MLLMSQQHFSLTAQFVSVRAREQQAARRRERERHAKGGEMNDSMMTHEKELPLTSKGN